MNRKISSKMLIIIVLIAIICILILIDLNKKNTNIEQQEISKEQLGETTQDNAYVGMQTHLSEVNEKEQKLVSFKREIASAITDVGIVTTENADATTMASNIRSLSGASSADKVSYVEKVLETYGKNQGSISKTYVVPSDGIITLSCMLHNTGTYAITSCLIKRNNETIFSKNNNTDWDNFTDNTSFIVEKDDVITLQISGQGNCVNYVYFTDGIPTVVGNTIKQDGYLAISGLAFGTGSYTTGSLNIQINGVSVLSFATTADHENKNGQKIIKVNKGDSISISASRAIYDLILFS